MPDSSIKTMLPISNVWRPASPARDASTEAFKEIRFVVDEIERISFVSVMESFSGRTEHLKHAMAEIAASIERITAAIDDGAGGITGAAGSTRSLVGGMV